MDTNKRTVLAEMHIPSSILSLLYSSKWKIFCLSNCSFDTGICVEKLIAVNGSTDNPIHITSTVILIMDTGSDDAVECYASSDASYTSDTPILNYVEKDANACK